MDRRWTFLLVLSMTMSVTANHRCADESRKPNLSATNMQFLIAFCPKYQLETGLCCKDDEVEKMADISSKLDVVLGADPLCLTATKTIMCDMLCSPRQADFMQYDQEKMKISISEKMIDYTDVVCSTDFAKEYISKVNGIKGVVTLAMSYFYTEVEVVMLPRAMGADAYELDIGVIENELNYYQNMETEMDVLYNLMNDVYPFNRRLIFDIYLVVAMALITVLVIVATHWLKITSTLTRVPAEFLRKIDSKRKLTQGKLGGIIAMKLANVHPKTTFIVGMVSVVLFLVLSSGITFIRREDLISQIATRNSKVMKRYSYYDSHFQRIEYSIVLMTVPPDTQLISTDNLIKLHNLHIRIRNAKVADHEKKGFSDVCSLTSYGECYARTVLDYLSDEDINILLVNSSDDRVADKVKSCFDNPTQEKCMHHGAAVMPETVMGSLKGNQHDCFIMIYGTSTKKELEDIAIGWRRGVRDVLDSVRGETENRVSYYIKEAINDDSAKSIAKDTTLMMVWFVVVVLYCALSIIAATAFPESCKSRYAKALLLYVILSFAFAIVSYGVMYYFTGKGLFTVVFPLLAFYVLFLSCSTTVDVCRYTSAARAPGKFPVLSHFRDTVITDLVMFITLLLQLATNLEVIFHVAIVGLGLVFFKILVNLVFMLASVTNSPSHKQSAIDTTSHTTSSTTTTISKSCEKQRSDKLIGWRDNYMKASVSSRPALILTTIAICSWATCAVLTVPNTNYDMELHQFFSESESSMPEFLENTLSRRILSGFQNIIFTDQIDHMNASNLHQMARPLNTYSLRYSVKDILNGLVGKMTVFAYLSESWLSVYYDFITSTECCCLNSPHGNQCATNETVRLLSHCHNHHSLLNSSQQLIGWLANSIRDNTLKHKTNCHKKLSVITDSVAVDSQGRIATSLMHALTMPLTTISNLVTDYKRSRILEQYLSGLMETGQNATAFATNREPYSVNPAVLLFHDFQWIGEVFCGMEYTHLIMTFTPVIAVILVLPVLSVMSLSSATVCIIAVLVNMIGIGTVMATFSLPLNFLNICGLNWASIFMTRCIVTMFLECAKISNHGSPPYMYGVEAIFRRAITDVLMPVMMYVAIIGTFQSEILRYSLNVLLVSMLHLLWTSFLMQPFVYRCIDDGKSDQSDSINELKRKKKEIMG